MLRLAKSLLPMLAALLYAGTAGAYSISVIPQAENYAESDTLTVDIWVDSGGYQAYGWAFWVLQDPAYLSPDASASHLNPDLPQPTGTLYLYPGGGAWYIHQSGYEGQPNVDESIATLVYHVIQDLPSSYLIDLTFNYGGYNGYFVGEGGANVTGLVVLTGLHIPEPTTTILLGLGFFGILYASRRQRRAA